MSSTYTSIYINLQVVFSFVEPRVFIHVFILLIQNIIIRNGIWALFFSALFILIYDELNGIRRTRYSVTSVITRSFLLPFQREEYECVYNTYVPICRYTHFTFNILAKKWTRKCNEKIFTHTWMSHCHFVLFCIRSSMYGAYTPREYHILNDPFQQFKMKIKNDNISLLEGS